MICKKWSEQIAMTRDPQRAISSDGQHGWPNIPIGISNQTSDLHCDTTAFVKFTSGGFRGSPLQPPRPSPRSGASSADADNEPTRLQRA